LDAKEHIRRYKYTDRQTGLVTKNLSALQMIIGLDTHLEHGRDKSHLGQKVFYNVQTYYAKQDRICHS
jgi:hypothetical protein